MSVDTWTHSSLDNDDQIDADNYEAWYYDYVGNDTEFDFGDEPDGEWE